MTTLKDVIAKLEEAQKLAAKVQREGSITNDPFKECQAEFVICQIAEVIKFAKAN